MIETDVSKITLMLKQFALGFGMDLLGAIVILAVGWWLAGRASALVRHSLKNAKFVDATLKPLAASIVRYAILVFVLVAVLSNFGVETTSIIAVLGAAGLAIGLPDPAARTTVRTSSPSPASAADTGSRPAPARSPSRGSQSRTRACSLQLAALRLAAS